MWMNCLCHFQKKETSQIAETILGGMEIKKTHTKTKKKNQQQTKTWGNHSNPLEPIVGNVPKLHHKQKVYPPRENRWGCFVAHVDPPCVFSYALLIRTWKSQIQ